MAWPNISRPHLLLPRPTEKRSVNEAFHDCNENTNRPISGPICTTIRVTIRGYNGGAPLAAPFAFIGSTSGRTSGAPLRTTNGISTALLARLAALGGLDAEPPVSPARPASPPPAPPGATNRRPHRHRRRAAGRRRPWRARRDATMRTSYELRARAPLASKPSAVHPRNRRGIKLLDVGVIISVAILPPSPPYHNQQLCSCGVVRVRLNVP